MTGSINLSVVMATYNRAETLKETIRHLSEQDLDPARFEVIIVDDGSPDNTREVVEAWMRDARFRLRYLHHSNHGPGYSQNRGLEVAEAPLVLLMADDIFMSRGGLSAHLAMHEANPEPESAVLGRVKQSATLTQSAFLRNWDPFRFSAFDGKIELPYYRFWACNISAKRDFLLRYGPFREHTGRAGYAAHEDPELGYQLHKAGLRILYNPAALADHYHVVTLDGACKRRYMQGMNFGEFRQFVPEPEIPVAYHVLTWDTVADHLRALFGPRRRFLEASDRNPALLLARHFARALVFNGLTVPYFWRPLLVAAETSPMLAKLMNREMYRGLTFHYFLHGCRDGDRTFGRAWRSARRSAA
jgi:glycosyltransferase involved in cell wall biosynthesis